MKIVVLVGILLACLYFTSAFGAKDYYDLLVRETHSPPAFFHPPSLHISYYAFSIPFSRFLFLQRESIADKASTGKKKTPQKGISKDATPAEIRRAYRRRAAKV